MPTSNPRRRPRNGDCVARGHFGWGVILLAAALSAIASSRAFAEPPSVSYIFPAGGQRGKTVEFKVGGHYLYDSCRFELRGSGVHAVERIRQTDTTWFDGPLIPKPFSQKEENYPK